MRRSARRHPRSAPVARRNGHELCGAGTALQHDLPVSLAPEHMAHLAVAKVAVAVDVVQRDVGHLIPFAPVYGAVVVNIDVAPTGLPVMTLTVPSRGLISQPAISTPARCIWRITLATFGLRLTCPRRRRCRLCAHTSSPDRPRFGFVHRPSYRRRCRRRSSRAISPPARFASPIGVVGVILHHVHLLAS